MTGPEEHPSARRQELLEAAYAHALRNGLGRLSLRPLAEEIHSSPRVLLYLFGSKDGLIRALLARARTEELTHLEHLARNGPAQWLSADAHRGLLTLWLESYSHSLTDPDGPWSGFAHETVTDWLALLSTAQPPLPERTLTLAVLRGALLDLLATGDTARVTEAVRQPHHRGSRPGGTDPADIDWCAGSCKGIVTASDAWQLPLFDRWSCDSGPSLGHRGGPFRVLSTSVVSDPLLERMHRGDDSMAMPYYGSGAPIDLRGRVAAFAEIRGTEEFWTRNTAALSRCAETALADAGTAHADIAHWLVPNFGKVLLRKQCFGPLKIDAGQTLAARGWEIGHTGAADPIVGLDLLRRSGALTPGDRLLLTGIGVGFTWGCAVVEYTGAPAPTARADEANEKNEMKGNVS